MPEGTEIDVNEGTVSISPYALYYYGGIYLDSDVEVLKNLSLRSAPSTEKNCESLLILMSITSQSILNSATGIGICGL